MKIVHVNQVQPPNWLRSVATGRPSMIGERVRVERAGQRIEFRSTCLGNGLLVEACASDGACHLDAAEFASLITAVYGEIRALARAAAHPYPIRWWNYIPAIRRIEHDGRDRYMVFNAGRDAAYRNWPDLLCDGRPVAASAVGRRDEALRVHALFAAQPGAPIENPRQVPASLYSHRYGPTPPHFARAILLPANMRRGGGAGRQARPGNGGQSPRLVAISGTASVVGEDSMHRDDLASQLEETFINLTAVIRAADPHAADLASSSDAAALRAAEFDRVVELRAYVVRETDRETVIDAIKREVRRLERLEIIDADLCRDDLLVEIEALAVTTGRVDSRDGDDFVDARRSCEATLNPFAEVTSDD